ncbi:MAG: LysR family transcriptional regulator [Lawsonibacter sp.]|nr:LysR family transcriptional regulator [Lawsonibacter sp.]
MELRNIMTFLKAAELGSFSKTAEALGYVQSTVTMQIQQLEAELERPLFDRCNRYISLTAFGEEFMPLAQRMYNTQQEMYSLSTDFQALTGTLRIGIVESMIFDGFLRIVTEYQKHFPNVLLDFCTASSMEICDLLSQNRLDLACYLSEEDTPSDFIQLLRRSVPMVFVANPENPLAKLETVPLERIAEEKLILTEQIGIYHQILRKLFFRHGLPIKERLRMKNTHGIVEILKFSGGVSFLPEYAIHQEVALGHLAVLRCPISDIAITVVTAVHKDRWVSPQMQGMLDLLLQEDWL